MSSRLTDSQIVSVCRELWATQGATVTIRLLQESLRLRFGRVGKTTRIAKCWREVSAVKVAIDPASVVAQAQLHVAQAERIAREALDRAEAAEARARLSEERERAHQDRAAMQIDDLRQRLADALKAATRLNELETRNLNLHRETARLRGELAQAGVSSEPQISFGSQKG